MNAPTPVPASGGCLRRVLLPLLLSVGTLGGIEWYWLRQDDLEELVATVVEPAPERAPAPWMGDSPRPPAPRILRRTQRTPSDMTSPLSPIEYESSVFGAELERLEALMVGGDPVARAAASRVAEVLRLRLTARQGILTPETSEGTTLPAIAGGTEVQPVASGSVPDATVLHPGWEKMVEVEADRHATFLHDARVEFRRLGLPESWDHYLISFLLESVETIDMYAALASDRGPRMEDFPGTVVSENPPTTQDPTLYAAWLIRQSTLRQLRHMGVPVDASFEHVLLNAGLGENLTPTRVPFPK